MTKTAFLAIHQATKISAGGAMELSNYSDLIQRAADEADAQPVLHRADGPAMMELLALSQNGTLPYTSNAARLEGFRQAARAAWDWINGSAY